jgi:hypothetical protein
MCGSWAKKAAVVGVVAAAAGAVAIASKKYAQHHEHQRHQQQQHVKGLFNFGNTCFLNAVAQMALRASRTGLPVIEPGSPLDRFLSRPSAGTSKAVVEGACDLTFRDQHDAAEAWDKLTNPVNGTMPSIAANTFKLHLDVVKQAGNQVHADDSTHTLLPVSLSEGVDDLQELVQQQYEGRPRIVHDAFRGYPQYMESTWVSRPPRLLMIQVGRFADDGIKITRPVDVPPTLVLPSVPSKWMLIAAVLHHGDTTDSGHYTAVIREPDGRWLHYNDEHVHQLQERRALHEASENGYLLLYSPPELATRPLLEAGGRLRRVPARHLANQINRRRE